ncbi:hypothetical protein B296_00029903 [Ensete ventricosum]|uniref:Uncharacterized protein n=1 Tax=Ensete ventricosum TaxID=4639 RepID=A0A426Z3Q5_ENSVE|nr:hypothetical protein B296_00029903 [Ensete ventricosum]
MLRLQGRSEYRKVIPKLGFAIGRTEEAARASKLLVVSRIGNEKVLPWMVSTSGAISCFDTVSLSQKLSLHRHALKPILLNLFMWDASALAQPRTGLVVRRRRHNFPCRGIHRKRRAVGSATIASRRGFLRRHDPLLEREQRLILICLLRFMAPSFPTRSCVDPKAFVGASCEP